MAFLAGVAIATITGLAYAELVTKYPQAAGASLYINKAFRKPILTFFITICMLSANMAAVCSLASGFVRYFAGVIGLSEEAVVATLIIALVFIMIITTINLIGISESVVVNVIMTFIELFGLAIIMLIGIIALVTGIGDPAVLTQFSVEGGGGAKAIAVLSGVSLAFFAMTGFENAANVAEETIDPARAFPRALIGGMLTAGVVYVLVSISAALAIPIENLSGNTLLEVVRAGILPIPVPVMLVVFGLIAMIAISNTTLVTVVAQARILYGMAREDIVPSVFAKVHPTRRSPYVALLFGAAIVGACCPNTYKANTPLLIIGIVGNLAVLIYTVGDDATSLLWVAGLLAVGLVLFLLEYFFGKEQLRPPGVERGDPEAADPPPSDKEH